MHKGAADHGGHNTAKHFGGNFFFLNKASFWFYLIV